MSKGLEAIPQVTREAQVLDRLRQAILDGVFPPGSPLNQVQIAAQFGTSRGPVRVALNNLEKEGLVRNIPYRGTFVAPLDKKHVRDLYGVRATLEAYGVRLAIENCQAEDVETVRQLIAAMHEAAQHGDTSEVIRLDLLVHQFFIEKSNNQVLIRAWLTLKIQMLRVLSFRHHSYPYLIDIAESHLPILEAMEAKDLQKAATIMEAHIQDASHDMEERWSMQEHS